MPNDRQVVASGLPTGVKLTAVVRHFGQFGRVNNVECKDRSAGAFLVTFESKEMAEHALANAKSNLFNGVRIDCVPVAVFERESLARSATPASKATSWVPVKRRDTTLEGSVKRQRFSNQADEMSGTDLRTRTPKSIGDRQPPPQQMTVGVLQGHGRPPPFTAPPQAVTPSAVAAQPWSSFAAPAPALAVLAAPATPPKPQPVRGLTKAAAVPSVAAPLPPANTSMLPAAVSTATVPMPSPVRGVPSMELSSEHVAKSPVRSAVGSQKSADGIEGQEALGTPPRPCAPSARSGGQLAEQAAMASTMGCAPSGKVQEDKHAEATDSCDAPDTCMPSEKLGNRQAKRRGVTGAKGGSAQHNRVAQPQAPCNHPSASTPFVKSAVECAEQGTVADTAGDAQPAASCQLPDETAVLMRPGDHEAEQAVEGPARGDKDPERQPSPESQNLQSARARSGGQHPEQVADAGNPMRSEQETQTAQLNTSFTSPSARQPSSKADRKRAEKRAGQDGHHARRGAGERASGNQAQDTGDERRLISTALGSQHAALDAPVLAQGSPVEGYKDATLEGLQAQGTRVAAPEMSSNHLKPFLPAEQSCLEDNEDCNAEADLGEQAGHNGATELRTLDASSTGRSQDPSNQGSLEHSTEQLSQADITGNGSAGSEPCPLPKQQWTSSIDSIAWLEDGKQEVDDVPKDDALKKLRETALRLLQKSHGRPILEGVLEARLAAEDPELFMRARQLYPSAHTLVEEFLCNEKAVRRKTVYGLACFQAVR